MREKEIFEILEIMSEGEKSLHRQYEQEGKLQQPKTISVYIWACKYHFKADLKKSEPILEKENKLNDDRHIAAPVSAVKTVLMRIQQS